MKKTIIIISIIVITSIISIYFILNSKSYNIEYIKDNDNYNITISKSRITLEYEYQPICIKAPCDKIKDKKTINFSKNSMNKVNKLIKELFKNKKSNKITINSNELNDVQNKILTAIINDDESLLNDNKNNEDKIFKITTNEKYNTIQNDGGSYYSTYYLINITKNKVSKYADKYVGFKGYEYQDKLIYTKNFNDEIISELANTIEDLFNKDDINEPKNYSPYILKINNIEKSIYNKESIDTLEHILTNIDNL